MDITSKLELNHQIKYLIHDIDTDLIFIVMNSRLLIEIKEGIRAEVFNGVNQTELAVEIILD